MINIDKRERGSTLIGVLILLVILAAVTTTILSLSLSSVQITDSSQKLNSSQNNSNSGLETALSEINNAPCETTSPLSQSIVESDKGIYYDVNFFWEGVAGADCNTATTVRLNSTGYSSLDKKLPYNQTATYSYTPGAISSPGGSIPIALFNANQPLNTSGLKLNNNGDIILRSGTTFTCNTASIITGNVIVLNPAATVNITSGCKILGSVYTNGTVTNISGAGTSIGGNVYSLGTGRFAMSATANVTGNIVTKGAINFTNKVTVGGSIYSNSVYSGTSKTLRSIISDSKIGGSVYLASNFRVDLSSEITGNITTSSTGESLLDNATVHGSVRTAGFFGDNANSTGEPFRQATIGGNLTASSTTESVFENSNTISGQAVFAGNAFAVNSMFVDLYADGGVYLYTPNPAPLTPVITAPVELDSTTSRNKWYDYDFTSTTWQNGGWNVVTATSAQCTGSATPNLLAMINGYTAKTVVDTRACNVISLYQADIKLKTDVTLVMSPAGAGSGSSNLQKLNLSSFDVNPHQFNLVVPDGNVNNDPTCSLATTLNLYKSTMTVAISGIVYTPCSISFGSDIGDRWRGQLYYGGTGGNTLTGSNSTLEYVPINLPGLNLTGEPVTGEPTQGEIGAIVSRRQI